MSAAAQAVLKRIKDKDIRFVDLRFTDTRGKWQHVTFDRDMVDADLFEEGTMFDGSSIAGWKAINESDMILMPDPETAFEDPFFAQPTLSIFCDVLEPATGQPYSRDPRTTAKAAEAYLQSTGIGDVAYFGPEAEFFVFDDVRWSTEQHNMGFSLDSDEGPYNSSTAYEGGNLATDRGLRAAIFRCRRSTARRTCAPKCWRSWAISASSPKSITTKSRPRSTSSA